jgi:peroxiredoxin
MRSKHLLLLFIVITGFAACKSGNPQFRITGDIKGLPVQTVVLEQRSANDIITIVDSARSTASGHFELSGVSPEPGLYRLHFAENRFILLSIDKGNIKIIATWENLENYTVNGSPASEHLKTFLVAIRQHLRDFNSMSIVLDTLQARGNDSLLGVATKDFNDMKLEFTQFVERYADTTPHQPNAVFAAHMLNPYSEIHFLHAFTQSLQRRFPGTKMTKEFTDYYAKVAARQRQPTPKARSLEPGAMAPELALPDVNGTPIALSSLKGKYVLIDFWASWCQPCRKENPNVVAAYEKYKGNNFTVYGVSLDNKKNDWIAAIKDDSLTWTQVCDLKAWSSAAAAAYAVQSIPSNFLIGPDGKIIARNLRGAELEETLEQVLAPQNTQ